MLLFKATATTEIYTYLPTLSRHGALPTFPAASAKGVVGMNTPFGNSITTAENAIALMFALARELPAADTSTQAGKWEKNRFMGVELTAKTLGMIGAGNIGSIVADRALGLDRKSTSLNSSN